MKHLHLWLSSFWFLNWNVLFFCYLDVCSEFQDIFDVDNFIASLRDEVRILKQLPPRLKRRVELGHSYSLPPISWSDISYYEKQVFKLKVFIFFIYQFLFKFGLLAVTIWLIHATSSLVAIESISSSNLDPTATDALTGGMCGIVTAGQTIQIRFFLGYFCATNFSCFS
jgi:hypothetical protein